LIVPLLENSEPPRIIMAAHPPSQSRVETESFSLLVVDDHAVVREGLIGLLDRHPDLEVIGEAADGEEAIRQADTLRPEAIIMDVDMPKVDGIEATRRIRQQHSTIVIVGLSLHEDEIVTKAMTEAGADAFVSKSAPARELVETIRRTCRRKVSRTRC
jgi:DNA-binding NarL/FixJ family response regulator